MPRYRLMYEVEVEAEGFEQAEDLGRTASFLLRTTDYVGGFRLIENAIEEVEPPVVHLQADA